MKSDAAIYTALLNRLAPLRGLPIELQPASNSARAVSIAKEGEALYGGQGIAIHPDTTSDLGESLAMHGVAFYQNVLTPRADGSRVDFEIKAWPTEFVRWRREFNSFWTSTRSGELVEINPGDGRWGIIRQHEIAPWGWGALIALAEIWMDRAYGRRDRAKASVSHGNAKIVGSLPEGVALQNGDGSLTPQASAFFQMLQTMHTGLPVGVKPFGSTLDMLVNNSTAWQIFESIISSSSRDANCVLLGQDGTVKNEGGNYVKSNVLYGVRNDIVEGDVSAFELGYRRCTIEPWAAINFGDSSLAPSRRWLMPDGDEDARRESLGERNAFFNRDVLARRQAGFSVTQEDVDELAKGYGVRPPVLLEPLSPLAPAAAPMGTPSPKPSPSPAPRPAPKLPFADAAE